MTLKEAIESIDLIANKGSQIILESDRKAMRLGIEALKNELRFRDQVIAKYQKLLPGETKEVYNGL